MRFLLSFTEEKTRGLSGCFSPILENAPGRLLIPASADRGANGQRLPKLCARGRRKGTVACCPARARRPFGLVGPSDQGRIPIFDRDRGGARRRRQSRRVVVS